MSEHPSTELVDKFGRRVTYLRMSLTDRCDFRCVYCMSEEMTFLPRAQVLTLEEMYQVANAFIELGVEKIRLTGGEPLIRNNVMWLIERLGSDARLKELVLTTNGSQLKKLSKPLQQAGVKRVNVSLDSLHEEKFKRLTRTGELSKVLEGIDAACDAGFQKVKINSVILKGRNDDEILNLVEFARDRAIDISFIEEMPLGNGIDHDRAETYCSSDEIQQIVQQRYPLIASTKSSGGPSVYFSMADSPSKIGFISPHSHNFCHLCNRVRLTAEGRLLLCLGNEHSVDLKKIIRSHPGDQQALSEAIIQAMDIKPQQHYFDLKEEPTIVRFMNTTGG